MNAFVFIVRNDSYRLNFDIFYKKYLMVFDGSLAMFFFVLKKLSDGVSKQVLNESNRLVPILQCKTASNSRNHCSNAHKLVCIFLRSKR